MGKSKSAKLRAKLVRAGKVDPAIRRGFYAQKGAYAALATRKTMTKVEKLNKVKKRASNHYKNDFDAL